MRKIISFDPSAFDIQIKNEGSSCQRKRLRFIDSHYTQGFPIVNPFFFTNSKTSSQVFEEFFWREADGFIWFPDYCFPDLGYNSIARNDKVIPILKTSKGRENWNNMIYSNFLISGNAT